MASARPVQIHEQALDNLRYIRRTMESAGSFTAVPGKGGLAMGITALAAAIFASMQSRPEVWLAVWIAEAFLALVIGVVAARRKARTQPASEPISGPARKFVLALLPAVFAGAVLTVILVRENLFHQLPALWLLLYGTAVVSGGAFSVRIIPDMGLCFLALGLCAALAPSTWGNWFLAAGFGAVQIVFGIVIARRYGG